MFNLFNEPIRKEIAELANRRKQERFMQDIEIRKFYKRNNALVAQEKEIKDRYVTKAATTIQAKSK